MRDRLPATSHSPTPRGLWRPLPQSRRLILDVLRISRKVPGIPVFRSCNLARVAELRKRARPRIGWPTLFMKAFAMVAAKDPLLRQTFMPWPWPHIYEHPTSTARMTVSRQHQGLDWVFFAQFVEPESLSLAELQAQVEEKRDEPVESIEKFRQQVVFSRFPSLLRRIAWWVVLNLSGRKRVRRLGTFGLTTVSARGAMTLHPPSIYTCMLTFGPVAPSGDVRVVLVYDHRILDGFHIAAVLSSLEATLNGPLADELQAMVVADADETAEVNVPRWRDKVKG